MAMRMRSCLLAGVDFDDTWTVAGRTSLALIVGTGKIGFRAERGAVEASARKSSRRGAAGHIRRPEAADLMDFIDPKEITYLHKPRLLYAEEAIAR